MDRRFRAFANRKKNQDKGWLELMEDFAKHIGSAGLYGEGDPITVNTYNGEDLLSQILQFVYFTYNCEPHVLLQTHGGCDVRGGCCQRR
jgi:hypothetical protein